MAINRAMYNGIQDIMNAYDRNAEVPYYSVWAGRDMIFSYNGDDLEQGRNHLLENLVAAEQNDHTDILKIKFHPKKEKLFITDKTPSIATLFVRVCDLNQNRGQIMPINNNYQNPQIISLLEKQNEMISGLNNRLALIEESEPEDLQQNNSETENMLGRIEGILNNPIVNLLVGILGPKLADLLVPVEKNKVASLAGIEKLNQDIIQNEMPDIDQQKMLEESLIKLNLFVENLPLTLNKLANYAEKNNEQFNMLVKML
jgi:hypothetical protein